MSDHDTKIRDLLDDLAGEVRVDPGLRRTTLRRARRRRVGSVAASVVVVVGLVTGGAVAARELRHQAVPAGTPTPSLAPSLQSPQATNSGGPATPSASPSQSPSVAPGAVFDTDLEDGRYIVFVKELDPSADPASMQFDLALSLTGDEANAYAAAHGMETPVPNDNLIINDNPKLRLMPLAADVEIDVIAYGSCGPVCGPNEQIDLSTFQALLLAEPFSDGVHAGPAAPYWLTIQDGTIIKVEEQYQA
jgi:hypothetical protein